MYFPLHPETPIEGRALADLFKGRRAEQIAAFQQQMKSLMDAEGLPYGERTMTWNSRLAQELGAWAEEVGRGRQAFTRCETTGLPRRGASQGQGHAVNSMGVVQCSAPE